MIFTLIPLCGGVHANLSCQHWTLTVFTIQVSFMKLGNLLALETWAGWQHQKSQHKNKSTLNAALKCLFIFVWRVRLLLSASTLTAIKTAESSLSLCVCKAPKAPNTICDFGQTAPFAWCNHTVHTLQHRCTDTCSHDAKVVPSQQQVRFPPPSTTTDAPWFELGMQLRCIYGICFLRQHPASARKPINQCHLSVWVEKVQNIRTYTRAFP